EGFMREILVATIVLGNLASQLPAQRSPVARGGTPAHFVGSPVVPPLHRVVPPLGATNKGFFGNFLNGSFNCFPDRFLGGAHPRRPVWSAFLGYGRLFLLG